MYQEWERNFLEYMSPHTPDFFRGKRAPDAGCGAGRHAQYPFRVCVNDQFDRLSAPIEFRYTRDEDEGWLRRAGLEETVVRPNYGWRPTGRKPVES
jgi:hypothetical protein